MTSTKEKPPEVNPILKLSIGSAISNPIPDDELLVKVKVIVQKMNNVHVESFSKKRYLISHQIHLFGLKIKMLIPKILVFFMK